MDEGIRSEGDSDTPMEFEVGLFVSFEALLDIFPNAASCG
jgi:hypothetical protein